MISEPSLVAMLVAPANPVLRAGLALAMGFVLLAVLLVIPVVRSLSWLRRSSPLLGGCRHSPRAPATARFVTGTPTPPRASRRSLTTTTRRELHPIEEP